MAKIVDPSASYMPLPKGILRGNPTPVDKTLVWSSEADLKAYAENVSETALSYVGQIVSLVSGGRASAYVIKDVSGNIEKLPFQSEVSGSIGPISGDIDSLKTSVSSLSGSIETLAGSMVEMDTSLRSAITSAASSAYNNAVVDAGTNVQSYLTNTYTPFVEGLISGETARATSAESQKIDKASIVASLTDSATNDQVPGAKATYQFVNSTITSLAAYYLTKNAAGDAFATKAELTAAIASKTFYNGGAKVTPKKNDYTIVQADESHSSGSSPTTRYIFDGTNWVFQYIVNNTTFTAAQLAAINSTITEEKLGTITGTIQTLGTNVSTLSSTVGTLDTGTLKTSGNQTASGTKTFSNSIIAGRVEITGTVDVSAGTADGSVPFVIGPKTGQHIAMDGNEIMSKSTGTAVGQLYLNNEGGLVNVGIEGSDDGSTGLKTKALWLGNVTSGLLMADSSGKVYKQTSSAGLVYDNKGTISYKGIGSSSDQVAAGNHTHSNYATTSTTATLSGYITSLQQQINALSGIYLNRFFAAD